MYISTEAYRPDPLTIFNGSGYPRLHTLHQTKDTCQEILRRWLEGQEETRQPVNWDTLIDSLIEAGFVDIATDLQEAVEDYPIEVVCI